MKNVLVLDCETTGLDYENDRVVEAAGVMVDVENHLITDHRSELINPGIPIPPHAQGVHHIGDADVVGKRDIDSWLNDLFPYDFTPAAHYAEFDSKFLKIPGDWICTNRCAKHLWPDAPSHSNQTLRYWIKDLDFYANLEGRAMPPHRALPDAWVTAHLLIRMLQEGNSVKKLIQLTKDPILLKTIGFGKHRGTPWKEAPRDYLNWILRQDFEPDVKHTANYWMNGGR